MCHKQTRYFLIFFLTLFFKSAFQLKQQSNSKLGEQKVMTFDIIGNARHVLGVSKAKAQHMSRNLNKQYNIKVQSPLNVSNVKDF